MKNEKRSNEYAIVSRVIGELNLMHVEIYPHGKKKLEEILTTMTGTSKVIDLWRPELGHRMTDMRNSQFIVIFNNNPVFQLGFHRLEDPPGPTIVLECLNSILKKCSTLLDFPYTFSYV